MSQIAMTQDQMMQQQLPIPQHASTTPIIRDLSSVVPMLTNVEDVIAYLEHDFRGESWEIDPQIGGQWVSKGTSLMNDQGIKNIVSMVHPYVNKIAMTSNFTDEEIGKFVFDMCCTLREHLATHYEKYEIDTKNLEIILIKIRSLVYECWKSAEGEGMRERLLAGVAEKRIIGNPGTKGILGGKFIPGVL
jgi:hypothetical protein